MGKGLFSGEGPRGLGTLNKGRKYGKVFFTVFVLNDLLVHKNILLSLTLAFNFQNVLWVSGGGGFSLLLNVDKDPKNNKGQPKN